MIKVFKGKVFVLCAYLSISCIPVIGNCLSASIANNDSLSLVIKAIDLSENMSRLSSQNDELLLLIYEMEDSVKLGAPIVSCQFTLDLAMKTKRIDLPNTMITTNNQLLLFLIEQDSDVPVQQLDPIIRIYFQQIIKDFEANEYLQLEQYLGDEDLLGVKFLPKLQAGGVYQFNFSGMQKLDKYQYLFTINPSAN